VSCFRAAFPYQQDVLTLPVVDLDVASGWYSKSFGMTEVERRTNPAAVILERDGVQLGFAVTGGDASNDGAAILVSDIHTIREELLENGVNPGELQDNERNGKKLRVFFVIAPDELCFYFHEEI